MTADRKKEQFMALVERQQLAELDALRVVLWTSRAEVSRRLLERFLPDVMEAHGAALDRLTVVAGSVGMTRDDFVRDLVKGRQRVPSLDELEKMTSEQLRGMLVY